VSIPNQLARLRAEALAAGEHVVATFVDQARSGASAARRPDYQRMKALALRGEIDRIRTESVDRGHRNEADRRAFEADMEQAGVEVVYLGEPAKQPPERRKLERGLRGLLAESEVDTGSQRTYQRMLYCARQGNWRGGPIPYGLLPDGQGWFVPDPESYAVLIWILEQRAQNRGYHSIAKALNRGIALSDQTCVVPPTPGLLAYRRKPYREEQDPETGAVRRLSRSMPSAAWSAWTIQRICAAALDGVYAGIYRWGETFNRFRHDSEGTCKAPVRIDTGKPMASPELLYRVQAVELAARQGGPAAMSDYDTFLLDLRCGACDRPINGYTSTKYKGDKVYRYRTYRCTSRSNRAGSCRMPMLRADNLEHAVLHSLFADVQQRALKILTARLRTAVGRRRNGLLAALRLLERERTDISRRRDELRCALARPGISPIVEAELLAGLEDALRILETLEHEQQTLHAGLQTLERQAHAVAEIASQLPDLTRWRVPEVHWAHKHAIRLLVRCAVLVQQEPGIYRVDLELYDAQILSGDNSHPSEQD
jgi:DNA invertase Pin-like site-specific DNA recombinase